MAIQLNSVEKNTLKIHVYKFKLVITKQRLFSLLFTQFNQCPQQDNVSWLMFPSELKVLKG